MHAPVVFIHGLIGSLQFPDMCAAFAPGRALAPDLLGYGAQRQVPVEAIDLPAQVEHLYRVIEEQLPGEAVHLVGHSVGGAVAMLFAQVHGERVRSLVSVEGNFSLCEKGADLFIGITVRFWPVSAGSHNQFWVKNKESLLRP